MTNTLKIGFANKFYTLWNITEEDKYDFNTRYHVIHYCYIKNISFDEAKVKELYPGVEIDLTLRGHSSFDVTEKITDYNLFAFGKYKGEKISESTDYSYMKWYFEDGCFPESKDIIKGILEGVGYHFEPSYNGNYVIYTPEDWQKMLNYTAEQEEVWKPYLNNEVIELVPERNLDEFGDIRLDYDIILHFPEFKTLWYNGYPYGLPMVNGKSKRFKNKNVKLIDYTVESNGATIIVNVNKFEINK